MRYEDASQTGSAGSDVNARDDSEHLAGNDFGPATGNLITGSGTISGATGTDMAGPGAHITGITGPGGSDTSFDASGKLEVAGQYGTLTIDAEGNYTYVRNPGSPEGVSETFTYTLADAAGATDSANLVINIGNLPMLQAQGNQTIQTNNGVVVLPAGVELSDVRVVGRDLVVTLPDGSTMVIPDGAIFVPQLVVNGVEVPASNLAALLIDSEPKPAAGDTSPTSLSSGGNFEVPVQPLDPGVPLGDLIPPTELNYTPPDFEDLLPGEINEAPFIGVSSVNVSEEGVSIIALPNPDNAGSPDTTNSPTNGGTIPVSDTDGDPLTVSLGTPSEGLTSQGVAITWAVSPDGHTLTGSAGGNTVITLVINDIGNYTVTLVRPVDHPTAGGEQGTSFIVPVSVSDGEDTTTGGAITVTIEDDSPTIEGRVAEPQLIVDDTTFNINDTDSVGGAFAVSYGADGPAAANPISYAMGINAGATGLFDTLSGQQVVLTLVSGVVIGTAGAGGPEVFRVSVDGSGNVTLDQSRAVVHNDPADPAETGASAATLAADNLVTVSIVATDRDGDPASLTVNIGQNLHFEDDGPSISVTSASEPQLTVDDTTLGTNASASFAGLFVPVFGNDGPATGGGIAYALSVTAGASGIVDVATGEAVNLVMNGAVVEGRSATTNQLVFTVSVDSSGVVTLDQIRAVQHNDPSDPVESGGSAAGLTLDTLVKLTATVTDGDGDTASATVNIGSNLHFEDDGPSISASGTQPTLTVDETVLGTDASASFAGIFVPNFGNDGAAAVNSVAYALGVSAPGGVNSGLVDSLSGHAVFLFLEGGQVVGREGTNAGDAVGGDIVFTVSVDSAGVVTLDQDRAVIHDDPSDPDEASSPATLSADNLVTLTATVTDRDGDTATATANIGQNLAFEDDGPSVTIEAAEEPQLIVDETNLPANIGPASFIDSFNIDFGADGPAAANSQSFSLSVTSGPSGLVDTATGNQVFLFLEAGQAVGREGTSALDAATGDIVFTVSVNAAGDVSLNQQRAVVHGDPTDPDEADTPAMLSADDLIRLNVVVADADGDTASASINIARNLEFQDDGPTILASGSQPILIVDETVLTTDDTKSFAGAFITNFGNDGPAATPVTYALGVVAGPSGLVDTATGQNVILSLNGTVVEGRTAVGGDLVFTVSVAANGDVTLNQLRAVVHNDPADPDEPGASAATLSSDNLITLTATATDGDGDTATATIGIGQNLQFEDDGPSITNQGAQPTLVVDETILTTDDTKNFAGAFTPSFGADGPAASNSVTYALGFNAGATGITDTLSGQSVVLVNNAGVIEGRTSGSNLLVFTVSVAANGDVTLNQLRAVVHNDPADPDEPGASAVTLANDNLITLTATATDRDGDTATAIINIGQNLQFEDDGPHANNDVDSIIGGNGPATGNVLTGVEVAVAEDANATDGVADNVGADTPGRITHIDHASSPDVDVPNGGSVNILGDHGTLTIYSNGDYSYLRTDAVGGVSDVFTYTLTDADGDSVTATLTIGIQDNFPVLPDPATILLDDDVIPAAGGNLDGPGDDNPDAVPGNVVNGTLVGSGGDAPLTYNFTGVNTLPSGFTIGAGSDADTLLINQGATLVMTIQLNQGTGAFTVTQNAPMLHPADTGGPDDNIENNLNFSIGVEVEDADHDVEPATITINVDDDTPVVTNTGAQPTLVVDETILTTDATQSFAGAFGVAYGADGPAAVNPTVYTLGVVAGSSGLVDTATGEAVNLVMNGAVVEGRSATTNQLVFTVSVAANGDVTLNQLRAVVHNDPADPDEPGASAATLSADNLITLTAAATDKDGDTTSASINIGQNLQFEDDGPTVITSGTEPQLTVDDTTLGTNASASFAGLFVSNFGADGAAAVNPTTYALAITAGPSGLFDVATGQAVNLVMNGSVVEGRTAGSNALVFTVSVNGSGVVTLDQIRAIQHNDPLDPIETGASAAGLTADNLIRLTATVTDRDGDTASATANIGSNLHFEDDGPSITTVTDPLNIDNSGTPTGTGDFVFSVGNDVNGDADDISVSNLSVTINGTPATNIVLTPDVNGSGVATPETATSASYRFTFQYDTGTGGLANASGTLVFDKTSGEYTVTLDTGPIQGFGILDTGGADASAFVEASPTVTIASLATDFHIQFQGLSGSNNTINYNQDATPPNDGLPNTFTPGELLNAPLTTVQVSSSAAGVAGNTIQGNQGEILDFNLYATNPGATTGLTPTASSTSMFLTFDTVAAGVEDMIIILKLMDPDTNEFTTRAVVVSNADLITGPRNNDGNNAVSPPLPAPYQDIVLDNNDGFLVIESNDYNGVGENYVIVGAQIAGGDSGITGTGINFNPTVGAGGGSVGTQAFSTDTHDGPFKITSVGFLTETTDAQQATIEFDVTITDGDGDTVTQTDVTVNIGGPDTLAAESTSTTKTTGPSTMEALSSHSLLVSDTQTVERIAANSNTVTLAAAVAAAGVVSISAAASGPDIQDAPAVTFKGVDAHVMAGFDASERSVGEASGFTPLHGGGFDLGAHTLATTSHTAIAASNIGELASALSIGSGPGALLEATDISAMMQMPAQSTGMKVAMAAVAESLVPAQAGANAQGNGTVEQIIADALHGGGHGPDINALLNALPGAGLGDNAGLQGLATQLGHDVPNGDMGHGGVFTFDAATIITTEAMVLHHDAVQPVANG